MRHRSQGVRGLGGAATQVAVKSERMQSSAEDPEDSSPRGNSGRTGASAPGPEDGRPSPWRGEQGGWWCPSGGAEAACGRVHDDLPVYEPGAEGATGDT